MPKILPPNRPQISRKEVEHIVAFHRAMFPQLFTDKDQVNVVWFRGYFGKSLGKTDGNDYNVYDDGAAVVAPDYYKTFNANTDPSFAIHPKTGKKLAKLNLGVYPFRQGKHKNSYWAFRAYPEAVVLPCTRDGKAATCQYVNVHYGGENPQSWYVTWSEACLTIPKSQFIEPTGKKGFQPEVYALMNKYGQKTINHILVELVIVGGVRKWRAGNGQIIPDEIRVEKLVAESAAEKSVPIAPQISNQTFPNQQPTFQEPLVLEIPGEEEIVETGAAQLPEINDCFSDVLEARTGQITGTLERDKETAARGMDAYETAIKVTSGKTRGFVIQIFSLIFGAVVAAFGYVKENWKLIAIGAALFVLVGITIYVVFTVINALKMKYAADPTKNNVE